MKTYALSRSGLIELGDTDEAKNPPIRTIRIDANKLFFMTAPPFLFFYFLKVEREISVKEVADLSIKDQVHHLGMRR